MHEKTFVNFFVNVFAILIECNLNYPQEINEKVWSKSGGLWSSRKQSLSDEKRCKDYSVYIFDIWSIILCMSNMNNLCKHDQSTF